MHSPLRQHLEKIPAFVTVVRLGSITKAAKALSISQAALSQSVRTLEEALGLELLKRAKTGVTATEEGMVVVHFGQHLLEEIDLLETRIRQPEKQAVQRLRIGTHEALAIHLWPEILESFKKGNPHIYPSLVSGRVDFLLNQLVQRLVDVVVSVRSKPTRGTVMVSLYRDRFRFYGPPGRSLCLAGERLNSRIIEKQVLNRIPILTDCQAHLDSDLPLSKVLIEHGLHSAQFFQLNSFQAASRLCSKGLGVALLPSKIGDATDGLEKLSVRGVNERLFDHEICMTFLKVNERSEALAMLLSRFHSFVVQS